MSTQTEQHYQAELLRQRQQEQHTRAEAARKEPDANTDEPSQPPGTKSKKIPSKKTPPKKFPISAIEVGLWLFPAMAIDTFEFFGQALAAIPIIGLPLAGASSVVGAVMSGIMFLLAGLWLVMKGIRPSSPIGLRVFSVLGTTTFGNAVINWLPAWSGFFLWLFFVAYKQTIMPAEKNK